LKAKYRYAENGYDKRGKKLPDIPILWLELKYADHKVARGPALVDTGFDGGLYANEDLALFLADSSSIRREELYVVSLREVNCEVFAVEGYLISPESWERIRYLETLDIYVPVRPEDLSYEAIVGREVLNKIPMTLNGKDLTIL